MDSLRKQLRYEIDSVLDELSYQGNMGVQEIFQFFEKASKKEIDTYHRLIKQNKIKASWQLIQMVLDVKLKGKEFEATVMQTTKAAGRTSSGREKMDPTKASGKTKSGREKMKPHKAAGKTDAGEEKMDPEPFFPETPAGEKKINPKPAAGRTKSGKKKMKPKPHWEVAPPGWGHTVAKKEKTKPSKPKSKIGGTAAAMKRAQDRGDIPKDMNIFALMWSMKNKGDKPHYKPGTNKKK